MTNSNRNRVETILLWAFLSIPLLIAAYQGYSSALSTEYPADFAIFKTAAEMLLSGDATKLYDINLQRQYFFDIVGPSYSQFLIWNHPPAEALFYLPWSFVTYRTGLLVIAGFNVIVLVTLGVWAGYRARFNPDFLFLLGLTFLLSLRPFSSTIGKGQDSLWILLVLVLALVSLHEQHYCMASLLLGIASVEFTVLLPLLFILYLAGFRKAVLDAVCVAMLLWLFPILVFGHEIFTSYLWLCLELPGIDGQWGMYSGLLWNFRGLLMHFGTDPVKAMWASIGLGLALAIVVCKLPNRFIIPSSLLVATFFSPHIYEHDAVFYTGSILLFILLPKLQSNNRIEHGEGTERLGSRRTSPVSVHNGVS